MEDVKAFHDPWWQGADGEYDEVFLGWVHVSRSLEFENARHSKPASRETITNSQSIFDVLNKQNVILHDNKPVPTTKIESFVPLYGRIAAGRIHSRDALSCKTLSLRGMQLDKTLGSENERRRTPYRSRRSMHRFEEIRRRIRAVRHSASTPRICSEAIDNRGGRVWAATTIAGLCTCIEKT